MAISTMSTCPKFKILQSITHAYYFNRAFGLLIEVRDSLNGIFGPWASWTRALARLGELLGRRRRRRRRHLEAQVDMQARKLSREFSNWNLTHMRDIWTLRPEFYTEFRAGLI